MAKQEENRIIASSLCYAYPDAEKNAVNDVTMRVKNGEFLAILGHNGSGKSTLAKLFNALYVPTGGTVWVCGLDTKDDNLVFDIRQHAGMVFQNPDNQIVATVVEEDVAFGLENNGVPPKEIRVRIDEALAAVNMSKHAKKAPHMLSGGQKQRVAIARIFLKNPPILILDEATSALDSVTEAKIQRAFDNLSVGRTTLIIAHRLSTIRSAHRIVSIADGIITECGSHEELLEKDGIYAALYKTQNALALEALK